MPMFLDSAQDDDPDDLTEAIASILDETSRLTHSLRVYREGTFLRGDRFRLNANQRSLRV
jgi:hypothetical protein